jgi:8-oxo-dGTP diphosphatase
MAPISLGFEVIRRAVAGIVRGDTGLILFARRAEGLDVHPGLWEFPGGALKQNETDERALARELNEELGIVLMGNLTLVREGVDNATAEAPWSTRTYLVHSYKGHPYVREPEKCAELRFFPPNSPPNPLVDVTVLDLVSYLNLTKQS